MGYFYWQVIGEITAAGQVLFARRILCSGFGWVLPGVGYPPHHNYYEGRNKADITPWLEYFLKGIATVFENATKKVLEQASPHLGVGEQKLLRNLDHRARRVLGLFAERELIHAVQVARLLGLSERQARDLLIEWV